MAAIGVAVASLAIAVREAAGEDVLPVSARVCFSFVTPDAPTGSSLDSRMTAGVLEAFGTMLFPSVDRDVVTVVSAAGRFVRDFVSDSDGVPCVGVEPAPVFASEA